jgi:hypothetical protein
MARKSNPDETPTAALPDGSDMSAAFNDWFGMQNQLFGNAMAQLANTQSNVMAQWLQMQTEWVRQWQEQAEQAMRLAFAGTGSNARPGALQTMPTAFLEAMWQPWGLWQRGSEQLG